MGDIVNIQRESGTTPEGVKYLRWGDHMDTMETVDTVFREQRKLSFSYGAVFFGVTLAVPTMTNWFDGWYAKPILGGFTANYLFVSILYFIFLWAMAWMYSKQADKLDNRLLDLADKAEARLTKGGEV